MTQSLPRLHSTHRVSTLRVPARSGRVIVALFFAFAFAIGVMLAIVISANEISKESHVGSSGAPGGTADMVSKLGEPVATAAMASFGTLFDLPSFDARA